MGVPSAAARAASTVLRSRQAIVIGPTPPGTGVIALARSLTASKSTSPTSPPSSAVDADVDHDRARLDPVGADHPRPSDRGDQHVGACADRRQIACARVAHRDRRVGPEQQLRHRLAEQVGAPDDDRLGALELDVRRSPAAPSRRSACTAAAPAARAPAGPPRAPSARRRPWPTSTRPVSLTPSRCAGSGSWTSTPLTSGSAFRRSISSTTSRLASRRRRGGGRRSAMPIASHSRCFIPT